MPGDPVSLLSENNMVKKLDQYNIVICGVGGQGLITLTKILAKAALLEDYEARTSELHGLSQRGGSVETHIRFGQKIYSPLVREGGVNLVIAIETQEALRACHYASKKAGSIFLINEFSAPIVGQKLISLKTVSANIKKFSKEIIIVPATEVSKKELGNPVLAGIYLLSLATFKGLIPLKPVTVLKAIKEIVPAKHFDLNKKTFELAKKYA